MSRSQVKRNGRAIRIGINRMEITPPRIFSTPLKLILPRFMKVAIQKTKYVCSINLMKKFPMNQLPSFCIIVLGILYAYNAL
jgi:hypothetical protein